MTEHAFGFTSIHPVLAVNDVKADLAYYRDILGFIVTWEWGDPTVRAGVSCGGLEVQLVSDGRFGPSAPSYVYVQMHGVDEYYKVCVQHGAHIMMELDDRPFGVRDFRVTDLSGNAWGFSQPLSE